MQQMLLKFIEREMPAALRSDQIELVRFLSGHAYDRPSYDLASLLMTYGQTPCSLLTTIMHCENMLLRHPRNSGKCSACDGSLRDCICYIERCSEMRMQLLAAIRKQQLHVQLDAEQLRIMNESVQGWRESGFLYLHNYFFEMPVTARVDFYDADSDIIEVGANREAGRVFASGNDVQQAFAVTPDRRFVVTLGLQSCRQGRLKLVIRAINPSVRESRAHLRVAIDEPYPVSLNDCGHNQQGRCYDISVAGMGLELDQYSGLVPGSTVACSIMVNQERLFFEALICWSSGKERSRIGLRFVSLGPFDEAIRKHIMECQQQLIQRVRTLSLPMWAREHALPPSRSR